VQLVSIDAVVRDAKGLFVPDLKRDDFEVYEDGIKQDLSSMTVVYGGRVTNLLAAPPPITEGLVLPAQRVRNDVSGRVLLFVIDDLHLDLHKTPVVRDLFDRITKNLLHEGDLFGMVSTGTSNIAVDLTYDRKIFTEAANRIQGNALSPTEIIQGNSGSEGPIELQHRAHQAFSTVNTVLENLDKVKDRRKIVIYVSGGYDFVPFQLARNTTDTHSPFQVNENQNLLNSDTANQLYAQGQPAAPRQDPNNVAPITEEFSDARLSTEMQDLTDTANRVNATIYTIDPRGVIAPGSDVGENVDPQEMKLYIDKSQDTLRVIAAETGGEAIMNTNEFDSKLKRIDALASDYYMLGYYAQGTDPKKRAHQIEVRVKRQGVTVFTRKTYVERLTQAPATPAAVPAAPAK
jgi:VWFA-related protein